MDKRTSETGLMFERNMTLVAIDEKLDKVCMNLDRIATALEKVADSLGEDD